MHELFGKRFFSHRVPAWHELGIVLEEAMGARDAFRRLGEYNVHCEPVFLKDGTPAPAQAVIRDKTDQNEEAVILSVMGPEFRPLGPGLTCDIYDLAVERPVETLGSLKEGETLFISTKLPAVDVKGDEVEMYLLLTNPMGGKKAITVRVTPQRVVCQNTLVIAEGLATETYSIRHDDSAQGRLHDWLKGAFGRAAAKTEVIKDACELLASYKVTPQETQAVLMDVYPKPTPPLNSAPVEVMKKRLEHREYVGEWREVAREACLHLFEGKGRGMDTPAAKGTAWGLYNAVCEFEDNRWAQNPRQALESAVFGGRANVKAAAFTSVSELVRSH